MTMKFSELTEHVRVWLQRQGRISYRALKREFDLSAPRSFRSDDPPEEKLGKLGNALLRTGMNLEGNTPLLASFLAILSVDFP